MGLFSYFPFFRLTFTLGKKWDEEKKWEVKKKLKISF